ncbi:MAG: hypothetical protein NXI31_19215 [bacterium]|nr:hypothetical protein [bacterium]
MKRTTNRLAMVVLLAGGVAAWADGAVAQSARDQNVKAYEKARKTELVEAGQRHVDLGWSMRKSGLQQQVTYEFMRAKELSEGEHYMAGRVLGIIRAYGDAFWRKARKKPTRASLVRYRKKAAALAVKDQRGQARLAKFAQKARLDDKARGHWRRALELGAELDITKKGAKIAGQKVANEHVDWLQGLTIEVDGKQKFDAAGASAAGARPAGRKAPALAGFREASSDLLVVRTDLDAKVCKELCAIGTALCEPLSKRLDGLPARTLRLLVFEKRADYDAYLAARGHGDAVVARGLCDYGAQQAMLCAEGLAPADLHAIALHELTHLFFWGCTPVRMPDFYAEGLAETFGGQGTFTWDGKKLTTGGAMRQDRVDAVKAAPLPLREMFRVDTLQLLAKDRDRALVFYAQAQLFLRFVQRREAPWRERFAWWENECRGALKGTTAPSRFGSPEATAAAFDRLFREDLDALETAFRAWLAEQ